MQKQYMAVIQAGGRGTRMRELTKDKIPKPMILLNGKPMIQWQIENIRRYGILDFVIITGHLGEKIQEYFGDGSRLGVHIRYIQETTPLGSAGALYYLKAMGVKDESFLFVYADVMFDIDWERMISFYESRQGEAVLAVHPNSHPGDSDLIVLDDMQRVTAVKSKNNVRNEWYDNCVNAGIFILSGSVLQYLEKAAYMDLEQGLLKPLIEKGLVFGYRTSEYMKDAGTIIRFQAVCKEQADGIWRKKNLKNRQKCVFLDRDGTVNRFCGLVDKEELLVLEEHVVEAVRMLNDSDFLVIVVTNQPAVARGMCNMEDIRQSHRKMQTLLGEQNAYLDDIVFCPHHPDKGFAGEDPAYKILCSCRKPATGMLDQMVQKYNIDLKNSYMVGDSTVDIQTGRNAGTKTILLRTGMGGQDERYRVTPDYIVDNLKIAAGIVLGDEGESTCMKGKVETIQRS